MSNGVSSQSGVSAESPISQITQALSGALLSESPTVEPNSTEGSDATGPHTVSDATCPQPTVLEPTQDNEDVPHPPTPLPPMSMYSSPALGTAAWCAHDFLLGAGMVIIQKNTHKIVVVHETQLDYWFFPRGRKDVGETIEQAAFREAYEESGFRVQPLPLLIPTRQPHAPSSRYRPNASNTEPIFMTMTPWQPKMTRDGMDDGGQYLTTWFAGQIEENAVPETGTGMPDERNFRSHLLPIEQAIERVWGTETLVLRYVWDIYCHTLRVRHAQAEEAKRREEQRAQQRARASRNGVVTFFSRRSAPQGSSHGSATTGQDRGESRG